MTGTNTLPQAVPQCSVRDLRGAPPFLSAFRMHRGTYIRQMKNRVVGVAQVRQVCELSLATSLSFMGGPGLAHGEEYKKCTVCRTQATSSQLPPPSGWVVKGAGSRWVCLPRDNLSLGKPGTKDREHLSSDTYY